MRACVEKFGFLGLLLVVAGLAFVLVTALNAQVPPSVEIRDGSGRLVTSFGQASQTAQAAAPVAKPAAAVLPALDELEKAWVQNVVLAQQLANSQCQALDSVKQFTAIRGDVTAKVEAKRPGFTMDWTTGLLAVKK